LIFDVRFCSFAFGELAEINLDLLFMSGVLLGSFVRPKETNQRKGRRNRAEGELGEAKLQLQAGRTLATRALLALPTSLKFAPFRVFLRTKID
jgi:hypothetical protein